VPKGFSKNVKMMPNLVAGDFSPPLSTRQDTKAGKRVVRNLFKTLKGE
jgi:hypothetical protein